MIGFVIVFVISDIRVIIFVLIVVAAIVVFVVFVATPLSSPAAYVFRNYILLKHAFYNIIRSVKAAISRS